MMYQNANVFCMEADKGHFWRSPYRDPWH